MKALLVLASSLLLTLSSTPAPAGAAAPAVALTWLGGDPPASPLGVSWGVPWPRGAVPPAAPLTARTNDGRALPTQSWPLAFWPDGSVKWSGLAIAADANLVGPLSVASGPAVAPSSPVRVREDADVVEIFTGPLRCRIARRGRNVIDSLVVDSREVARDGRLIAVREDRSEYDAKRLRREEEFTSRVTTVTVEQSGPVRAVVRIEGRHEGGDPARAWLPFVLRLYFTAGLQSVRIVHSFVFDGDASRDFIRGLGLAFSVPFREERQNRHVRFSADDGGLWVEPVLMSPGYRAVLVKDALAMNRDQLEGRRIPNLAELGAKTKEQFETIAVWDAFKLAQLTPDSFAIEKRTGAASSWLQATRGRRAGGLVFLGDVSGGLAVGVRRFWEKHPAALEVTGASTSVGEVKVWLWSPDAPAMDLRHYDVGGHGLDIAYEDIEPGFSTPEGIANTSELTLWATATTPDNASLVAMAQTVRTPPLLMCAPAHYHGTRVFGIWSLPDRSTPDQAASEEQLDRAVRFFEREVAQRHWYGFWDFGDFMRSYDSLRHQWRYDIGGHAWNNTELIPDAWLWYAFLRSGRADVFSLAEAMTRHTSEVDVHHAGRFAGLGSRHNVSHWGCSAKEARISAAFLKRFYYYLTTDERTGDLMREVLTVDEKVVAVPPLRKVLPKPSYPVLVRSGPDWLAFASNWMTEWERTGDGRYRDYILAGMKSLGAMPDAFTSRLAFGYDPRTKQLFDVGEPNIAANHFIVIFGGDQIVFELLQLIDCPEFTAAWNVLCAKWARTRGAGNAQARITAYAAQVAGDAALGRRAWQLLHDSLRVGGRDRFPAQPLVVVDPGLPHPVEEIPDIDPPAAAQWALNLITGMEFLREFSSPPRK